MAAFQPAVREHARAEFRPPAGPARPGRIRLTLVSTGLLLLVVPPPAGAAEPVTFYRDVAPIVWRHCAPCHRPGASAPFPLLTVEDVRRRSRQIAEVTESRFMPPWLPEPGHGEFAGERRLSDDDIAVLREWAAAGAPAGDPASAPEPPRWVEGWQLGEPDLIVRMAEPFVVPAEGGDVFRNFVLRPDVTRTRYVEAVEFRPDNARVVHHARILVDRSPASRRLDMEDDQPGYDGMLVDGAEFPDGHFLGWAPGRVASPLGERLAWRLDPGVDLVLQLHVLPTGKPEPVRARIGLHFADGPPSRWPVVLTLGSKTIDIPAGEAEYQISDRYRLPAAVDLLGVYPHAHYLGKTMRAWAERPDGSIEPLIRIDDWDFNWQDEYRYREPVRLAKDTVLVMEFGYDNSAQNVRNPHRPPRRVVYGSTASDEMGELLLQVLPVDPRDRGRLAADAARKELEAEIAGYEKLRDDRPGDPDVRLMLAYFYQQAGREHRARELLEEAVRVAPEHAPARYNLGTALSREGEWTEAVEQFTMAVNLSPEYPEAHNNLAVALQALGRGAEALAHLRIAVALDPDYLEARENLGLAYAAQGMIEEAVGSFREALERGSGSVLVRAGLAWILATASSASPVEAAEAVRLAEEAAEATARRNAVVLDTLAAAYAAAGRLEPAARAAEEALDLAERAGNRRLVRLIEERLRRYRALADSGTR